MIAESLRKLLVATGNRGKLREINDLLEGLTVEVVSLACFPKITEPEETGDTFAANALLKAEYYHNQTGLTAIADDSGLGVDALDGRPGIYSARYGGPNANDVDRYKKLLQELQDVPTDKRSARFVCVAAIVGNGIRQTFTGTAEGQILRAPRGDGGFGYDPVFYYPALVKTFAELTREEKSTVSHRGKAIAQLTAFLRDELSKPSQ
jgi:XTP/dITP diphosphohydrolase